MSEALNREYHAALGWTFREDPWRHIKRWYAPLDAPYDDPEYRLPALHTDASLCIAELDRVFGPDWLTVAIQESYLVAQYVWHDSVTLVIRNVHRGANFTEAALKCLIAAHKRESEAV